MSQITDLPSQNISDGPLDISVIIPVYNEEASLPILAEKVTQSLDGLSLSWEVVFVNDGSTDQSAKVLRDIAETYPGIVLAFHRSNFGKSNALSTGFHISRGRILVTLDADLQDDPTEIHKLLQEITDGYDLVIGQRINRRANDPIMKTVPSLVANWMTRTMTGVYLKDMNSGFKVYRREVVEQIYLHSDLHRYIPILAVSNGFRVKEVPVAHHPRQYGHSKYGAERYIRSLFDLLTVLFLTRFRYRPLHFFGSVGIISGTIGVAISGYLSVLWFLGQRPIGDRPLLLLGILLILVGIQFTLSGLIADLIVSIDLRSRDPMALVRHVEHSTPTEEEQSLE